MGKDKLLIFTLFLVACFITVLLISAGIRHDYLFKEKCESIGGHILNLSRSTLCLSKDDRVINDKVETLLN